MVRKIGAVAIATALLVASGGTAFAASGSDQAALAPGKAAGLKEAALRAPAWVWVAGVGFVALGAGLVASGNGNGSSAGTTTSTHL